MNKQNSVFLLLQEKKSRVYFPLSQLRSLHSPLYFLSPRRIRESFRMFTQNLLFKAPKLRLKTYWTEQKNIINAMTRRAVQLAMSLNTALLLIKC